MALNITTSDKLNVNTAVVFGLPSSGKTHFVLSQVDASNTLWCWSNNIETVRDSKKSIDTLEISSYTVLKELEASLEELSETYDQIVLDGFEIVYDLVLAEQPGKDTRQQYQSATQEIVNLLIRLRSLFNGMYIILGLREDEEEGGYVMDVNPQTRRRVFSLCGKKALTYAKTDPKTKEPVYRYVTGSNATDIIPTPLTGYTTN